MNPALHQDARPAKRQSLLDLCEDHVIRQYIGLRVTFNAIESTECAKLFAHICVIDIPIDDVTDDVVRVQTLPNAVRACSEIKKIRFLKKTNGLVGGNAAALRSRV